MQNNHSELWNLVDLIEPDLLGTFIDFKDTIARPIKAARAKDADAFTVELGKQRTLDLNETLRSIYIQRYKEEELGDELPEKDEYIILCELSDLQKQVYKHMLKQADFKVLIESHSPCDCGINNKYVEEYQRLRTKEQRIEYQRKRIFKRRFEHCYSYPKDQSGGLHETYVPFLYLDFVAH